MNAVALITGASRGIGRGIAVGLARIGCDVAVNFRTNETAARQTAADCIAAARANHQAIRCEICKADIAIDEDRRALVGFVKSRFGRLDVLVNNAGVAPEVRADLLDAEESSFDRVLNVNVKGPYFLTQLAARCMIEQTQAGSVSIKPKIITITSISAYAASPDRGEYCVAKAALSMLTPLFAARLASHGINVYEIRPGIIETDMTAGVKAKYDCLLKEGLTPIKRWGTPGDVALAVAAIVQDSFPFSTGEVINVDGGFHLRSL
ncbi:MAG TPA: 3-ketoacyl-ACP reductase [Verrucomicrobiae bacterium]|nr:3-ketoacyl-ACP reductase [Verrucomicrobiae bacterium]